MFSVDAEGDWRTTATDGVHVCVSVCHTKASLFHQLTNVTNDVTSTSEQYLKQIIQNQTT